MSDPHRIQSTVVTTTVARQTPKNDFGDELANALEKAKDIGTSLIGAVMPGMPVLSAAVSGISNVVSGNLVSGGGVSASVGSVGSGGSALGGAAGAAGLSGDGDINSILQQIGSGGPGANEAYLKLQMRMQQESQQFTAVSNILKVRSDSAKAAINNIR